MNIYLMKKIFSLSVTIIIILEIYPFSTFKLMPEVEAATAVDWIQQNIGLTDDIYGAASSIGWNTQSDLQETSYSAGEPFMMGNKNIALYARQTLSPTYTIAGISNQTMIEQTEGYASETQETKEITVTKTGTGDISNLVVVLEGTNADDFTITQPIVGTLDTTTSSTAFTVEAKNGLEVGTHEATVTVSADNMTDVHFSVTQVVNAVIPLTVSGITATDKDYDGTTSAELDASAAVLHGVVDGDQVSLDTEGATGTFDTKTSGTNKAVTVTGLSLTGPDALKYTLSPYTTTADITSKELTIREISADDKEYDGTTNADIHITLDGIVGAESVTAAGIGTFDDTNVGNDKAVHVTGITLGGEDKDNYSLAPTTATAETTADITLKEITVTGIRIADKIYDGTTDIEKDGVTGAHLTGVINGDDVGLDAGNITVTFEDPNVGEGKTVSVSGYALRGVKSRNYKLIQPTEITGNILPEIANDITVAITSVTSGDTAYDGNWINKDVAITLTATAPSGIKKYQYTIDDGTIWKDMDTNILTVSETADHTYKFRVISNGDSSSNVTDGITVKVDKTKPKIGEITGNPAEPKRTEQTVSFKVYETNSGIYKENIVVKKGDATIPVTVNGDIYSFVTQRNGQYKINVSDNVSNAADEVIVEVTKLDFEKPIIDTFTPAVAKRGVDIECLTAVFNENIMKSTLNGDIIVYREDGTVFEKVDVQNNRVKVSENKLYIYFTKPLEHNTGYYVAIQDDILSDLAGNSFDGITSKRTWSFTTAKSSTINSLSRLDILVLGEQYPAVVDPIDDTKYTTIAEPDEDGIMDVRLIPELLNSKASVVLSTAETGVTISGNRVKVTDTTKNQVRLALEIRNKNGSETNKVYTLTIVRGSIATKVREEDVDTSVQAEDLKGAIDLSSEINAGKQLELVLNIKNSEDLITYTQKEKMKDAVDDQSIALFLDIGLVLNNITDDDPIDITNTQNPVTIRFELPEYMRDGKDYKVIRSHGGIIDVLDTTLDGDYLIFATDRFSQYAIAYTENTRSDTSRDRNDDKKRSSSRLTFSSDKVNEAYIKGYDDNTFKPDNNITRAEVITIISRLSEDYDAQQSYTSSFWDLETNGWYVNAVGYCSQKGIINGYEDGTFKPEQTMTRAEFAAVTVKFAGLSVSYSPIPFSDVKDHWAEKYIAALMQQGSIAGYEDGSFRPDAPITRAEAVKIINSVVGRVTIAELINNSSLYKRNFNDIEGHWAYYEIIAAANNNITYYIK